MAPGQRWVDDVGAWRRDVLRQHLVHGRFVGDPVHRQARREPVDTVDEERPGRDDEEPEGSSSGDACGHVALPWGTPPL
jgi:hypothetical protein